MEIRGCKVFSATKIQDRNMLGDEITEWLLNHPETPPVDTVVVQSSDDQYHCMSIVLWF